ncbi:hypothetical protein QBC39DRAFT_178656 [Podospora conica]|nr:hypothetical protein QBC39DRAFT_178656 [Schizothecium conicum]
MLPPTADHDEFTAVFLPRLRIMCNVEQGPDFAAVIHGRFGALVRDYVVRWGGRKGLWVRVLGGTYVWNQDLVDEHFNSVETVAAWLRASGILEPWEQVGLGTFVPCLAQVPN